MSERSVAGLFNGNTTRPDHSKDISNLLTALSPFRKFPDASPAIKWQGKMGK